MKAFIGLTGKPLAGKETVSRLLEHYIQSQVDPIPTIQHAQFSDALRETLTLWDIPINRDTTQKIAQVMRDAFGEDAVSNAFYRRVANTSSDIVIADGVRWFPDEKMIRRFKERGLILYVEADTLTRFGRMKGRRRNGEETTSWAEFLRQDAAPNEINVEDIGSRADAVIKNGEGADPGNLFAQIKRFVDDHVRPLL